MLLGWSAFQPTIYLTSGDFMILSVGREFLNEDTAVYSRTIMDRTTKMIKVWVNKRRYIWFDIANKLAAEQEKWILWIPVALGLGAAEYVASNLE